jgi:ABC-type phosphate transport system ATPase subunit
MDKRKQDSVDWTKKDAERKATTERKAIENKPTCAALMDEISDKGRDHVKKLTVGQQQLNLIRLQQMERRRMSALKLLC